MDTSGIKAVARLGMDRLVYPGKGRRIVVDVSGLVRWIGPPVGIIRVESELARAALRQPNAVLCLWDKKRGRFRSLSPKWVPLVTSWCGRIDASDFDANLTPKRRGWRRVVPSRQPIIMALERMRLSAQSDLASRVADGLQRIILALRRHGFPLDDDQGRRITSIVPYDLAVGDDIALAPSDSVLFASFDWYKQDLQAIAKLKTISDFRLVVICYDLIPLLFPEFFAAEDVERFRKYWLQIMPVADLIIFNSRCIEADARRIASRFGLRLRSTAVAPLGFDMPAQVQPPSTLPGELSPGRYALFVSTVEPRKGHAMLLRVWRKLLARNIPQRNNFRLVFVGRPGWMVEDVLDEIGKASADGTVLWLKNIDDNELDNLYRAAAFCLYASCYEGFGLPIIEAFAHGKAVIASSGGALPETVGGLSPCLDPADETAWEETMAEWIDRPQVRADYEARIRTEFSHMNWPDAARGILKLAAGAGAA